MPVFPHARATITRYTHGALRASIEVPALADHAELVPHELEHVLEQIDGWDLPGRASVQGAGVFRVGDELFETRRAVEAGLAAVREVHDGTDPALAAAGRGIARVLRTIGARAARPPDQTTRAVRRR